VDLLLKVKAQAYSVEAADVRHELDYQVWEDVKFPDGKIYIPGVIAHKTTTIEPPGTRSTPYRAIRQHYGTRERHCGHGLWVWEPGIPGHRVGQDESHGGRCSTGHPATLAPLTLMCLYRF